MKIWDYKNIAISPEKHRKLAELSWRTEKPMKVLIEEAIDKLYQSHEPRKRKGKT